MIYIIMGVSGSGKTTVGRGLARGLNIPFYDADDFHPRSNIEKMRSGTPLEDEDRWPWLELLRDEFPNWDEQGGAVLACSALKESYRILLKDSPISLTWIYLAADYDLIYNRIKNRRTHYFKSNLLQSQFDALEVPMYGIHLSVNQAKRGVVKEIINMLHYE